MTICWKTVLTLVKVIFQELQKVRVVAEHAYNFPARANALYLWEVLQTHRVMVQFVCTNFREHPMFHPKKIMFLFKTSVPKSEIDRVSFLVNNVRNLPTAVRHHYAWSELGQKQDGHQGKPYVRS